MAAMKKPAATRKPAVRVPGYKSTGVKVPVAKTATGKPTTSPKVIVKPKTTPTPTPKKTLPTLAEYKSSAASKSMSYKQYLDYFKGQGYK